MALTVSQQLPSLSLAGNNMRIAISTDNLIDSVTGKRRPFYIIFLQIFNDGVLLFEESLEPDANGVSTFNISEIVSAAIKPTLFYPHSVMEVDQGAIAPLSFKMAEGFGIPFVKGEFQLITGDFLAMPGGCADWYLKQLEEANSDFGSQLMAANHFLTNQPQERTLPPDAFAIVRAIIGISGSGSFSLRGVKTLSNGTTENVTLYSNSLDGGYLFEFNVSPAKFTGAVSYTFWLHENQTDLPITPIYTYHVSQNISLQQRNIIFRNSLGGWDTACATGRFITEMELQRTSFESPIITRFRDTLQPGADRAMGIRFMKGSIGFVTNEELNWLQELALSEEVYIVTERGLESIVLKVDRWPIADDDLGPKTLTIEAIVGNSDFFFHD